MPPLIPTNKPNLIDVKSLPGFYGAEHWAAGNGHEAVVKLLLAPKADVNANAKYRETALH
jgi:hypothetical protein